jgi:hypothetical protein
MAARRIKREGNPYGEPLDGQERIETINRYAKYDDKTYLLIDHYESRIRGESTAPYPKYLFEERSSIDGSHNENANAINRDRALALFRYVFEEILNWTPEDAANNFNAKICSELDLNKPLTQLAPYFNEVGCTIQSDYFYVAKLCYPDRLHSFGKVQTVLGTYKAILEKPNVHFSSVFFSEGDVELKAAICLMYVLSHKTRFKDVWSMYQYFADDTTAKAFISQYRLQTPLKKIFLSPLHYLHQSLSSEQRDPLYYDLLSANKLLEEHGINIDMEIVEDEDSVGEGQNG